MNFDESIILANAHRDPAFFDEETVDEEELNRKWEDLKDLLDQASVLSKDIYETCREERAMVTNTLIDGALRRAEEAVYE